MRNRRVGRDGRRGGGGHRAHRDDLKIASVEVVPTEYCHRIKLAVQYCFVISVLIGNAVFSLRMII